jgi:endothelin-converting enzyme
MLSAPQTKKPESESTVCLTPACVHASSEILYNLSPNYKEIDPCSNFEELVCGGWDDRHDLRPDQGDAFTGTIMSENSQMLLRHILEAPYPNESKVSYRVIIYVGLFEALRFIRGVLTLLNSTLPSPQPR